MEHVYPLPLNISFEHLPVPPLVILISKSFPLSAAASLYYSDSCARQENEFYKIYFENHVVVCCWKVCMFLRQNNFFNEKNGQINFQ